MTGRGDDAQTSAEAAKSADRQAIVGRAKVARLARAIASGEYRPDPAATAAAMLSAGALTTK